MAGARGMGGGGMGGGGMGGGGMGGGDMGQVESPDRHANNAPASPGSNPFGTANEEAVPESVAERPSDSLSLLTEQTESVAPPATRSTAPGYWALQGVGSLQIDIQQQERNRVTFRSLGEQPRLMATLVNSTRLQALDWTAGLIVAWIGLLLMRKSRLIRIRFILLVLFLSTAVPLVTGLTFQLGTACDIAFLVGCLLIPFYLLIAISRSMASRRRCRRRARRRCPGCLRPWATATARAPPERWASSGRGSSRS